MKEDDHILIKRYLLGSMAEGESKAFEKRLQEEPVLYEELSAQMLLRMGRNMALTESIKQISSEELGAVRRAIRQQKQRRLWLYGLTAAAACLIIGLLIRNLGGNSPEVLYAEFFAPYPGATVLSSQKDNYQTALASYEEGDYATALQTFDRLDSLSPIQQHEVTFYQANARLALGQTEAAIKLLQHILNEPDNPYAPNARYYLALAHLAEGEGPRALAELKTVREEKAVNQDRLIQAEELIRKLEELLNH